MYKILVFWSKTMPLERTKKKYFYKAYLENKLKSSFSVKNSRLKNKLIEFKIILIFFLRYPEIFFYVFFWNRLIFCNMKAVLKWLNNKFKAELL